MALLQRRATFVAFCFYSTPYPESFLVQKPDAGKMRATHVKGTFPSVKEDEISEVSISYYSSKNASGLLR